MSERGLVGENRRWSPTSSPSDADASFAGMDELREALRDGLREEAAPIARRLAEVKGLEWNAIHRLERLEATLDAERSARVDDLALLVELLTEGWRTLNARLDRIEELLRTEPPVAEVYRLPTADAG